MSTIYIVIALSFILVICLIYFIAERLFVISKNPSEICFWFQVERGSKVLVMDFLQWKTSPYGKVNALFSLVYDHILDYYLVGMYLMSLVNPSMFNTLLLVLVLGMISSQMVPALKKYSLKYFSPTQLRNFTYVFNLVIFTFLVNYTCAGLLKNTSTIKRIAFWRNLLDQSLLSFLGVLILNFSISDFVNAEDFKEERSLLNKKSELKTKYAALQHAYVENEEAIFQRAKLVRKMQALDSIEKKFWEHTGSWDELQFDYNYWQHDLESVIKEKETEIKSTFMDFWPRVKSTCVEAIYNFCYRKMSVGFFEDFLYLLLQIFSKNQVLLRGGLINIEDYYGGNFSKYDKAFSDITNFYHGLKNKETIPSQTYKQKYLELVRGAARKHKKKLEKERKLAKDRLNFEGHDEEEEVKPKSELKRASNFLHTLILHDERHDQQLKSDSDYINCTFNDWRVKFFNLSNNLMKRSNGFQEANLRVLSRMIMMLVLSRVEYMVGLLIIGIQVYKGAMENFFILGILFFFIFVESHLGNGKWWTVLFNIYLAKCTLAYIHELSLLGLQNKDTESGVGSLFYLFVGTPAYTYDAFILISIFAMNVILRMRGFSDKYLIEFEDPGSCIARVGW